MVKFNKSNLHTPDCRRLPASGCKLYDTHLSDLGGVLSSPSASVLVFGVSSLGLPYLVTSNSCLRAEHNIEIMHAFRPTTRIHVRASVDAALLPPDRPASRARGSSDHCNRRRVTAAADADEEQQLLRQRHGERQ